MGMRETIVLGTGQRGLLSKNSPLYTTFFSWDRKKSGTFLNVLKVQTTYFYILCGSKKKSKEKLENI